MVQATLKMTLERERFRVVTSSDPRAALGLCGDLRDAVAGVRRVAGLCVVGSGCGGGWGRACLVRVCRRRSGASGGPETRDCGRSRHGCG